MQNITVCVITYNSELTILDTLNSIKSQSYNLSNIELIISDDCSKDNTKTVINDWLEENKSLFFRVNFIIQNKNLGVSKNINTAWKSATSTWIKTIAGDDFLSPNCLASNINYANNNTDAYIIFSYMRTFYNDKDEIHYDRMLPEKRNLPFFQLNNELQFQFLLKNSFNIAPSSFIHRTVLKNVNFADERFSLIEDLPLWLKITKYGYQLHFNPNETVYYRISDSLSNSRNRFINIEFTREIIKLHQTVIRKDIKGLSAIYYYDKIFELKTNLFIAKISNNKRNIFSYSLQKIFSLCRPRWYALQLNRVKNKCIG